MYLATVAKHKSLTSTHDDKLDVPPGGSVLAQAPKSQATSNARNSYSPPPDTETSCTPCTMTADQTGPTACPTPQADSRPQASILAPCRAPALLPWLRS